jgi:hypothetical protein
MKPVLQRDEVVVCLFGEANVSEHSTCDQRPHFCCRFVHIHDQHLRLGDLGYLELWEFLEASEDSQCQCDALWANQIVTVGADFDLEDVLAIFDRDFVKLYAKVEAL